jgi:hypothetical protein
MSGDSKGDKAAEEETNFFLITLQQCRDTLIPSARDAVYAGQGDPGSSIASAINGGGWECDKATEWVSELLAHTRTVMPAFDDAIGDVGSAISAERGAHGGKDTVPKGDPHGLAWNRTWHNIQRMEQY